MICDTPVLKGKLRPCSDHCMMHLAASGTGSLALGRYGRAASSNQSPSQKENLSQARIVESTQNLASRIGFSRKSTGSFISQRAQGCPRGGRGFCFSACSKGFSKKFRTGVIKAVILDSRSFALSWLQGAAWNQLEEEAKKRAEAGLAPVEQDSSRRSPCAGRECKEKG